MTNQSIAILITCHNRCKQTISCIESLYKSNLTANILTDIFLVDDGSTDGTTAVVKNSFPKVKIISGDGNLYWNRGMYLAWKTASETKSYDFYLWLNDDTILFPESIDALINQANNLECKRIIVGTTCSAIDRSFTYGGYKFYNNKVVPNGTWQDCDYFNGNIVLIPYYVFQKVGLLDYQFVHALGDFDYGMRSRKMGFIHVASRSFMGLCERHTKDPKWRDPSVPILKRFKFLYSPLGKNPVEAFISDRRHHGVVIATYHYITLHFRTLLPQIWMIVDK